MRKLNRKELREVVGGEGRGRWVEHKRVDTAVPAPSPTTAPRDPLMRAT